MVVDEDLLDRLEQLEPKRFEGQVYRVTFGSTPAERANTRGARWNPPDVAALYTSLESATVLAEAEHLMSMQPVQPRTRRTLHALNVNLAKVLDLRSHELLAEIGISEEAIRSLDFLACRRIGEAACRLGFNGILVPSARSEGSNLVIYPTNGSDSDIEVLESEPLGEEA